MNKDKNNHYDSIEEQSLSFDGESSPPVEDTSRSVKTIATAVTLFGMFVVFGLSSSSRANFAANGNVLPVLGNARGPTSNLDLPSYMTALDETDPEWDAYANQLTSKYVIGDPGKGNLIPDKVALVKFVEPHFVYRTYGGDHKASQCGYWWVMDPPTEDKDSYFDHFAICPEWNDASDIIRCRVPVGYIAAVGEGQTVSNLFIIWILFVFYVVYCYCVA